MKREMRLAVTLAWQSAVLITPSLALTEPEEEAASPVLDTRLALDPATPQVGSVPSGLRPAFGEKSLSPGDYRFDFRGILIAPLRVGLNTREDADSEKSETVLHAPPVVPDDLETFSHTGVVPNPYVQLNLSYGNSVVTGVVSILARQTSVSTGFFDAPSQAGVNDVYLDIRPDLGRRAAMTVNVGAFTSRYGTMGEYDEGRYDTPLIARVNGVGERVAATLALGRDLALLLEQGIVGSSNKAASDLMPEGWNGFADPNVGSTFAHHWHGGLNYDGKVTLGAHYVHAFSRDDRATGTLLGDGTIRVLGSDLRLSLGRYGHLLVAGAHTTAKNASSVGNTIEILNTRGGPGLMENYLGDQSGGNGKLMVVGGQYDLSVGRLVSYPVPFTADGPDIVVSLFGMSGKVLSSDDALREGQSMWKAGGEVSYTMLSWLGTSLRFDRVVPDVQLQDRSFSVVSPRVVFKTDWSSTDQVVLQYSHWFNGPLTTVRTGYPPREDPRAIPDQDMISLSANMWW